MVPRSRPGVVTERRPSRWTRASSAHRSTEPSVCRRLPHANANPPSTRSRTPNGSSRSCTLPRAVHAYAREPRKGLDAEDELVGRPLRRMPRRATRWRRPRPRRRGRTPGVRRRGSPGARAAAETKLAGHRYESDLDHNFPIRIAIPGITVRRVVSPIRWAPNPGYWRPAAPTASMAPMPAARAFRLHLSTICGAARRCRPDRRVVVERSGPCTTTTRTASCTSACRKPVC